MKTVRFKEDNSSVCELTVYDIDKLTKDKLYGISKKLFEEKSGMENYLSKKTNDLFDLHDEIILYDLINNYFANDSAYFLKVTSPAKALKETAMKTLFEQRFEDGLECIKAGLNKKSGVKTYEKVVERIGRMKQKYPSVHNRYTIEFHFRQVRWLLHKISNYLNSESTKYLQRKSYQQFAS